MRINGCNLRSVDASIGHWMQVRVSGASRGSGYKSE